EVMQLLCSNELTHYLTSDEMRMLNDSNEEFTPMGYVQVMVESGFDWSSPVDEWCWVSSSEIARCFGFRSTKGLKGAMEACGAAFTKKGGFRGYLCPKLIRVG
ncbi:MAG: hypothetical protein RR904_07020, partial [Bacilli bacterium]